MPNDHDMRDECAQTFTSIEEQVSVMLGRIDERLSSVEGLCENMNEKLFTGNGDSVVTRLRLAEANITEIKDSRRGKIAMVLAVTTGLIAMVTSVVVAFIGK